MTTSNYYEMFSPEATKTIGPLAEKVAKAGRELESLRTRLVAERETGDAAEAALADLKATAGDHLTRGTMVGVNAYGKFKTSLEKRAAKVNASRETARLFSDELVPRASTALAEAKTAVQKAFLSFASASRPACESKMAELIEQVLIERDDFMVAFNKVADDYGCDFTGQNRQYPDGQHIRPSDRADFVIATGLEESLVDSKRAVSRRGDYLKAVVATEESAQEARSTLESTPSIPGRGSVDPTAYDSVQDTEPTADDAAESTLFEEPAQGAALDDPADLLEPADADLDLIAAMEDCEDSGPAAALVDSEEGRRNMGR